VIGRISRPINERGDENGSFTAGRKEGSKEAEDQEEVIPFTVQKIFFAAGAQRRRAFLRASAALCCGHSFLIVELWFGPKNLISA
jgi:hypothetical protein